jgi:hypothetical protein
MSSGLIDTIDKLTLILNRLKDTYVNKKDRSVPVLVFENGCFIILQNKKENIIMSYCPVLLCGTDIDGCLEDILFILFLLRGYGLEFFSEKINANLRMHTYIDYECARRHYHSLREIKLGFPLVDTDSD